MTSTVSATDAAAPSLGLIGGHAEKYPPAVFMERGDIINIDRAVLFSRKDERTIRRWCTRFGIGRKSSPGAPWEISAPALLMVLQGDQIALELLRNDDRESPRVVRYFNKLGLSTARDPIR